MRGGNSALLAEASPCCSSRGRLNRGRRSGGIAVATLADVLDVGAPAEAVAADGVGIVLRSAASTDEDEVSSSSEPMLMLDCIFSCTHEGVMRGRGVVLSLQNSERRTLTSVAGRGATHLPLLLIGWYGKLPLAISGGCSDRRAHR